MNTTGFETINPDGYRLVGETSGGGDGGSGGGSDVLLVLHGGPGGGTEYLLPAHQLAAPDRRVVSFDQLGTARSEVPPADYPWSQERAAADIDAVRQAVGAERVDVFGHSWGGTLALQYALDFPHRVGRLVLSNTTSSVARMTIAFLRQLTESLTTAEAAAAITADAVGDHTDPTFRAAAASWLARYMGDGSGKPVPELTDEALQPDAGGRGLWGSRLWFADGAARNWDVEGRLPEIDAPALVVHGGRDTADVEANRPLAAGLRNSTWIVFPDAGHDMFTGPDASAYLAVINNFLRGWTETKEHR